MIPEQLHEVPRDRQVRQTFGLHPVLFGLILLGLAISISQTPSQDVLTTSAILLALVLVGFFLLFYEWNRRGNRVVLSRFPEGIAIYRKKKLDLTVQTEQIALYSLRLGNSFNYMSIPALASVAFVTMLVKKGPSWEIAILGVIAAISLLSMIYTRFLCVHYLVPKKARGSQEVILGRADTARLFSS